MSQLKAILALPTHQFLADDLPYDQVSMRSLSGFKQWNDAYLTATPTGHNSSRLTRTFRRDVFEIQWLLPTGPARARVGAGAFNAPISS